jgi:hypothetical protein
MLRWISIVGGLLIMIGQPDRSDFFISWSNFARRRSPDRLSYNKRC